MTHCQVLQRVSAWFGAWSLGRRDFRVVDEEEVSHPPPSLPERGIVPFVQWW